MNFLINHFSIKTVANNSRLFFVFLLSLFFLSCEDIVDVELPEDQAQFSIDAVLNNRLATQRIRITQSIPYFDNSGNYQGIEVDSVVLSDQNNNKYYFTPESNGYYVYTPIGPDSFLVGNTYTLSIYKGIDSYVATSKLNRSAPIDSISAFTNDDPALDTARYFVFLNARDVVGRGDHYWVRTYRNGVLQNAPNFINPSIDGATGGANNDGFPFIFPVAFLGVNSFNAPYRKGEEITIELLGIEQNFFEFLTLASDQLTNGGLFARPIVNLRTNFKQTNKRSMPVVGFFSIGESFSLTKKMGED
jgi:hypothetical protein